MRSPRIAAVALLASTVVTLSLAPSVAQARAGARPGGSSAGDPYFPRQGNTGYGVASYNLHITYSQSPKRVSGAATIRARSRQNLSLFTLDLRRNMKVSSVTVDGHRAAYSQPARLRQELRVRPVHSIAARRYFTVVVRYAGRVVPVRDPNGSLDGIVPTNDGVVVVSEPQGAPTWFPVNDTPNDKARYALRISVPGHLVAVSNGAYRGRSYAHGRTTWSWHLAQNTSSYLVTMAIGKFAVSSGRTPRGVPYVNAVDPKQKTTILRKLPAIVDYFSSRFGRYHFGQTGGIVENAPFLGYSLETATRPVFDRAPSIQTLSHELGHQWFGDYVTVQRWRDIWLNEGFAQFASWLWDGHRGATSARAHLRHLMAVPASNTGFWNPPPGNPRGPRTMFAGSVYDRGAGALQALREKIGSGLFFRILRGWLAAHRYGNARVPQFIAYVEKHAHRDLTTFFHEWLYRKGKPRV